MTKSNLIAVSILAFSAFVFADVNVPVITPRLKGSPVRPGPPIGYVVHPMEGRLEELAVLPINAELSNIFLWRMKDQEKLIVDFEPAAKWLQEVYKSGRQAYPILDTSVFHSSDAWRVQITGKAGENMVGADGKLWEFTIPDGSKRSWASLYSPMFRKMVFDYVDQLVDWIKINDPNYHIPGYIDGAEWFMPATLDYNPLGIAVFQKWLENKYGTLEKLNQQWGSNFSRWKDANPPRGTLLGNDYVGMRTIAFGSSQIDCGWISPKMSADPNEEYKVSAKVWQYGVPEGLCAVRVICYNSGSDIIQYKGDGQFYWTEAPDKTWEVVSAICKLPADTRFIRMGLRLLGPGEAKFTDLSLKRWPLGEELLPPDTLNVKEAQKTWSLEAKTGKEQGQVIAAPGTEGKALFCLSVPPLPLPYRHTGVAWEDWVNFSFESMAGWLNTCAQHIKQRDKDRQVISYIGCVFGFHSLGDFNTYWQRLDISLANSPDITINGIQVCIADRDFSCTSFPIDDARKYGKPIYATDIIDFPYGLYSGFEPIYRGALAAVQHGMNGMFCYSWYDPAVQPYDYSTGLSKTDQIRFISDVKTAAESLQGYRLYTKVAMLHPLMSYSLADDQGRKSDLLDSAGLYSLILEQGIIPDIWTPYEISKKGNDCLKQYDLIFIADCPVLDEQTNQILLDFVKNGGVVIGSGRSPQIDLSGSSLSNRLVTSTQVKSEANSDVIRAVSNPVITTLGKGKIFWINDKVGRDYLGKVRRWRVSGNTPPPFMHLDYSSDAQSLRRYLRRVLSGIIAQSGVSFPVKIDASEGAINIGVYKSVNPESANDLLIFLIHTGYGRSQSVLLKIDPSVKAKHGRVWSDFDRKAPVEVDSAGMLKIPDFAHSSIITLTEK